MVEGGLKMKHIQKLRKLILALGILAGMSMTAYAGTPPTVTISPEGAGTVAIDESTDNRWEYILTANPNEGYAFYYWDDGTQVSNLGGNRFGINGGQSITCVFTETYTVTYKVVGGTWSDGTTADKTETVMKYHRPQNVPTGMVAATGYTGGSWDTDPSSGPIRAAKTFTYTFVAPSHITITAKADPYNTGAYYATFYDSTTSYVADCEVYYATENADGRFTLEKAEGNVIKAGEGVILKATSETVTLTKTTTEASYDSLLIGSNTETTVENALVLSLGKNGVWFYKYSGTLGANKAYLAQ